MKKIIGFTGKKQSGKDSACDMLAEEGYKKGSFASILKDIMWTTCVFPTDYDYETQKEEPVLTLFQATLLRSIVEKWFSDQRRSSGLYLALMDKFGTDTFSARSFLQFVGTDWGRNTVDKSIWVKATKISDNMVFSDVRFDNEALAIRNSGGYIVHLIRDGQDAQDDHESEQGIDESLIDHTIVASDLEELRKKIKDLL